VAAALVAGAALGAAPAAAAAPSEASDATLTWGISGYAQVGVFGPWSITDLGGDAALLTGSVSGGSQDAYLVDPVPATSFPTAKAGKTANAVRFSGGEGTVDTATGAGTFRWAGSYTVSAYPASFNAPPETFRDPILTVAADGSGSLSFELATGVGADMDGATVPAAELGRLTVLTFSAGAAQATAGGVRLSPDYRGVVLGAETGSQVQCTAGEGATGWWGSWAPQFVAAVPASLRPHYYSTGCGGAQDTKPPLPVDLSYQVAQAPQTAQVTVSSTRVSAHGTTTLTVTGTGFDPSLATGTRPPFAGQASGLYVAFGRYADVWRPSAGAPSSARVNPSGANGTAVGVKWAVPAASFAASSPVQDPSAASYTVLGADGSFTTQIQVNSAWLAQASGTYGIYTYAAGGATVAAYETATPLTFVDSNGVPVDVTIPEVTPEPEPGQFAWSIAATGSASLGTATATANGFVAAGALPTVTVTDTRDGSPAWSLSGQASGFTGSAGAFGAQALGWAPSVTTNTVDAVAGAAVQPGGAAGDGLSASATLASSAAGHAKGSVQVGAALSLLAPAGTPSGSYTSTLTLTALS
jgi:hypothetical protein